MNARVAPGLVDTNAGGRGGAAVAVEPVCSPAHPLLYPTHGAVSV